MLGMLAGQYNEGGTVADVAKELGLETNAYDWRTHWPMILAKRAVEQAKATLSELDRTK